MPGGVPVTGGTPVPAETLLLPPHATKAQHSAIAGSSLTTRRPVSSASPAQKKTREKQIGARVNGLPFGGRVDVRNTGGENEAEDGAVVLTVT